MRRMTGLALIGTTFLLGGCWYYASDVDVVGDARVTQPVFADGVYCTVIDDAPDVYVDRDDCVEIAWLNAARRHLVAEFSESVDAELTWIDAAPLTRGLSVVQFHSNDDGDERFAVAAVRATAQGYAIIPPPEPDVLRAIAADLPELEADISNSGDVRLDAGPAEDARAFVRDGAVAWLEARLRDGGSFGVSDEGPIYYVRVDDWEPDADSGPQLDAAVAEIQRLVTASATLE